MFRIFQRKSTPLSPWSKTRDLLKAAGNVNESTRNYAQQCVSIKYQRWTIIVALLAVAISIFIAIYTPIRQKKLNEENKITSLYRSIIGNEDIFISNFNNRQSFLNLSTISELPEPHINYEIDSNLHEVLQKKLGLVNYRFLLYYLDQTDLMNKTKERIFEDLITKVSDSMESPRNRKIYLDTINYLSKEKFETKFNYLKDTECLAFFLKSSFSYIGTTKLEKDLVCSSESLDRKFYHFSFRPDDTPTWERRILTEAVKYRIDISGYFN